MKLLPASKLGTPIIPKRCVRSITPVYYANKMTNDIISYYSSTYEKPLINIVDACSNIGGNCISFSSRLNVLSFEIDKELADILQWNLSLYNNNANMICGDFVAHIKKAAEYQCIFIDPPWFISNKFNNTMMLSNVSASQILSIIQELNPDCLIIFKVPKNYDYTLISRNIKNKMIYGKIKLLFY